MLAICDPEVWKESFRLRMMDRCTAVHRQRAPTVHILDRRVKHLVVNHNQRIYVSAIPERLFYHLGARSFQYHIINIRTTTS